MTAVVRTHAPDTTAFDAYVKQWFYDVVVPQYLVSDPVARRSGEGWVVTAKVKNVGTGTMPIEVAATAGKRFPKKGEKAERYVDARAPLTLAAGQEASVTIPCAFKPEKLTVDPDVMVLQLERDKATVPIKFSEKPATGLTASR